MINNTDKKVFKALAFLAGIFAFLIYSDSQEMDTAITAAIVVFLFLSVVYKIIKWLVFSNLVRTILSKSVVAIASGVIASVVLNAMGIDSHMVAVGGGASMILSLVAINS